MEVWKDGREKIGRTEFRMADLEIEDDRFWKCSQKW